MKDAVVIGGLGVVGQATRNLFGIEDYFDTRGSNLNLRDAAKRKYVFITLPTEPSLDGYDIEHIYEILRQMKQYPSSKKLYILRSTVIPGTTDALSTRLKLDNIVYMPEFLTMRTIKQDTFNPDILVVGATRKTFGQEIMNLAKAHIKNQPEEFLVGTREAEMIKLGINMFYVTKVVWANQIYDVCQRNKVDYEVVKDAFEKRKFMSRNHFDIWVDNYRGAGGKCLRKDLIAFNRAFGMPLFTRMEHLNEELISQRRDAE